MIVHMIGNAHIDPVWLWRWSEGLSEMVSTCRTMVGLLKKSDDLVFTKGEAAMYEWIEKTDPNLFEEIAKLIRAGRWEIVNGWWVQPDCNLPSGESFVRQSLYGKRYFFDRFGVDVKTGYNVDSFGHAATLPQILKKSGFEGYVFMRPNASEKDLPSVFRWRSPDGSETTAFRLSRNYETRRDRGNLENHVKASLADASDLAGSTMSFYGVGNHGGGPTMAQVRYVRNHRNFSDGVTLEFSTTERYFDGIKDRVKDLPVVEDELQYHSIGSYSVNSKIKIMNRKCENSLLAAEGFAAIASEIERIPYPYERLEKAWKSLLFNQFHDLLGGTSVKESYEDACEELGGVIHEANRIKQVSLQTLAASIDTDGGGMPFTVFNPSPFEREEYVEFEPWLNWGAWRDKILVDPDGEQVEYQRIHPSEIMRNTYRILFRTKVPPMGYCTYRLRKGEPMKRPELQVQRNSVENGFYRLEFTDDGRFKSFYDEKGKIERFSNPSNVPLVINDRTDTWSHGIPGYPRESKSMKGGRAELIENGTLRTTFRIVWRYKNSRITEYVSAYADDPVLRVHFTVNWHEPYKLLKLGYFFEETQKIFAEVPYGIIERPADGREYPMQRAVFFEGDGSGLMIANNGKYAYDALNGEGRITVLRNPPYAWHMPAGVRRNRPVYFTDEGVQEFDLWIAGYPKDRRDVGLRYARALNEPLEVLSVPKHLGNLPPSDSFVRIDGEGVLMEVLKMSESKDGSVIMRVWECTGKDRNFSVNIFGKKGRFKIGKFEIKTIGFDGRSFYERNLLENASG